MNSFIEALNRFGEWGIGLAPELLLQSSLLILVVLVLDLAFRRPLRASVRYGLWLLVLLKLCLPPSLAFPTGVGWWVRSRPPQPAEKQVDFMRPDYAATSVVDAVPDKAPVLAAVPRPAPSVRAWAFVIWAVGLLGLLSVVAVRCLQVARMASAGTRPESWVEQLMNELAVSHRLLQRLGVRVIDRDISPALFGLFRPTILLPRSIVTELKPCQLRMVLLHELIHLKRGDMWINCFQSLLQVFYWWHPLVWCANARLRQLREEAVDDAVLQDSADEPQAYATTLLKVATVAMSKLRPTVGLVGILERSSALSRRIRRIANGNSRARSGLTIVSIGGIAALGAIAIPMGEPPAHAPVSDPRPLPGPDHPYQVLDLDARFLIVDTASLRSLVPEVIQSSHPLLFNSQELPQLENKLRQMQAVEQPENGQLAFVKFSGGVFQWRISSAFTNNWINYKTTQSNGRTVVFGADAEFRAGNINWNPLQLVIAPLLVSNGLSCKLDVDLDYSEPKLHNIRRSQISLVPGAAALWEISQGTAAGISQLVLLTRGYRTGGLVEPATPEDRTLSSKGPEANAMPQPPDSQPQPATDQTPGSASEVLSPKPTQPYKAPLTGWRAISAKLQAIRLDKVEFRDQRLQDVAAALSDLTKKKDADGKGIDFFLDRTVPLQSHGLPAAPDLGRVRIAILPALMDIRLCDLLDAIVKVADRPITYAIEDSGVVFGFKGKDLPAARYSRVFRFDPNSFAQLLDAFPGGSAGTNNSSFALRDLLASWGVTTESPNAWYYKPREGILLARATLQELDRIERAIAAAALDTPEPSNGFESPTKVHAQPESPAPSTQPQIVIHATFVELPEQALRSRRLKLATNSIPRVWELSELQALKKVKDAKVLSAQSVTTLSGCQAQIQTAEMKTVVNGVKWPVPDGLAVSEKASTNNPMTPTYLTETLPFGPSLDVLPVLGEDGKTIELDMVAKVTEFLGYDDDQRARGAQLHVPLPHFRINSISTRGTISDGECLLLPTLKATDLSSKSDARTEMNPGRNPKAILVFVRATLLPGDGSKDQPK